MIGMYNYTVHRLCDPMTTYADINGRDATVLHIIILLGNISC